MSEEKKCMKNELCEGVKELSMEDLEQVSGGHAMGPNVSGVIDQAIAQSDMISVLDGIN